MIRRHLGVAVATALLVGACAGTTTTPTPAPASAAPASAAPASAAPASAAPASATPAEVVTLKIESWRSDDKAIWTDTILPAFTAKYPNIKVEFTPTLSTEYDPSLVSRLEAGSAGDLITCRPFDTSLNLFQKGYLAALNDLPGINENFPDSAKSAWQTDDGKTIFCVPMASVIHGFFYNKEVYTRLGLQVPATWDEFLAQLDTIKKEGKVDAMVLGVKDQWPAALNLFHNIGPDYYGGEEGRKALIAGTLKFTDKPFVDTFAAMAQLIPYLEPGYPATNYQDAQTFFTLGKAAVNPAGSWDIQPFYDVMKDNLGYFPPPVPKAGDQCYIEDHVDIAMGMNAKTAHPEAAKTFLAWLATPEFATMYSNALPGFFSLSNNAITLENPVAQQVLDARKTCKSTIRLSYQILGRGQPNLENDLWIESAAVMNKTATPEQAVQKIQKDLDSWYKPAP